MSTAAPPTTAQQVRCIVGCAMGVGVSFGPAFIHTFSVLVKPMADDFGWGRAALVVAITICSAGGVLLTPFVGLLIDRIGARLVALSAVIALPCASLLQSLVPHDYTLYLAAAVASAALSATAHPATYMNVIARVFDRRLGIAIAAVMIGIGVGQATIALVTQQLLDAFGWRSAWMGIAAITATIGLLGVSLIPWRAVPAAANNRPRAVSLATIWPVLIRSPLFWTLGLSLFFILLVAAGMVLHLIASLRDKGFSGTTAASVAAVVPLFGIAGRLLTGALVDRISYVYVGGALFFGLSIGCVLLATTESLAVVYLAVALLGLGFGAESDLLPYIVKRRFGIAYFGSTLGLMSGFVQSSVMLGPLLAAVAFDAFGDYRIAFISFSGITLVATGMWIVAHRLRAPEWATDHPDMLVRSSPVPAA